MVKLLRGEMANISSPCASNSACLSQRSWAAQPAVRPLSRVGACVAKSAARVSVRPSILSHSCCGVASASSPVSQALPAAQQAQHRDVCHAYRHAPYRHAPYRHAPYRHAPYRHVRGTHVSLSISGSHAAAFRQLSSRSTYTSGHPPGRL